MNLLKSFDDIYYDMTLNQLRMMNKDLICSNITYNSLLYIDLINYTEDCTVSHLAKMLNVSKSAVTIKVNELIKQGLIEKTQSESDRRVYYLTIKPKLTQEFKKMDTSMQNAIKLAEKHYSSTEIGKFCEMLDTFRHYYKQEISNE